jgi:hypothetical protein
MFKTTLMGIAMGVILVGPAAAEDLTLECKIIRTDANGSQFAGLKRFEYTFATKVLRTYENYGSEWVLASSGHFEKATDNELVNKDDEYGISTIDRTTGDYYAKTFKDDGVPPYASPGTVYLGRCDKVNPPPRKF